MSLSAILLFFCSLHLVHLQLQINLHLTNWTNENDDLQHDCLYVPVHTNDEYDSDEIISYCMGEWPSKFDIKKNNFDQKFTFSQLAKRHITSEQLYAWSAPIDLTEDYQLYLNELPHSENTLLAKEFFYNCTLPYFGSKCQYILSHYNTKHTSLYEIVSDYYNNYTYVYVPTLFTCYTHLKCNRGPPPSCLDWTEICDGKIDCLDDGLDEKYCWQLELHQCNENEFQCSYYGQCIPQSFFRDDFKVADCLDQSDRTEYNIWLSNIKPPDIEEPSFLSEDISCVATNNIGMGSGYILTSSCVREREKLLADAMFSITPDSIKELCWKVVKCILGTPNSSNTDCSILCHGAECNEIINRTCPDIVYIPAQPLFGHVYLAYDKYKLKSASQAPKPTYVCYDNQFLDVPDDGRTLLLSKNKTCRLYEDSKIGRPLNTFEDRWITSNVHSVQRWLHRVTVPLYNHSTSCNQSIMYQCMHVSKCISRVRLFDMIFDCLNVDDEDPSTFFNHNVTESLQKVYKCKSSDKYIPSYLVNDGTCNCKTPGDSYCADENSIEFYFEKTISFQTICDSKVHLSIEFTADKNITDETDCEHWPPIHIYNRCDGFWNFLNGSDELNCDSSMSLLNCSDNHHLCVSAKTYELMCLPIEKTNDGIVDCIGAADEPKLCRSNIPEALYPEIFRCRNDIDRPCILGDYLCDGHVDCSLGDDEQNCKDNAISKPTLHFGICTENYELLGSDIAKVLCRLFVNSGNRPGTYFTLDQSQNSMGIYSKHGITPVRIADMTVPMHVKSYQPRCHRGLDLQVWLDKAKKHTKHICLCPPSFYGNICQYQNQRVSLTLQFRVTSVSSKIPFIIMISLIDDSDERLIHSYQQLNYLSTKYCQRKFNFYLLYSTRPKDSTKNYSIKIDFYEKITLNYRGSLIRTIDYSFLPVHRVVLQLDNPRSRMNLESCSDKLCINGKCLKYLHDPKNTSFCQCNEGWIGQYCTIKHNRLCSSGSICAGQLANNRSLCICPSTKIGPRCLINNEICQINPCLHGGRCISTDHDGIVKNKFICLCRTGFSGDRCERFRTKLTIIFDQRKELTPIIFHFFEVKINQFPVRTTTLKRIIIGENSITIYWPLPFHVVFMELSANDYYLIAMQKIYKQSSILEKRFDSTDRCLHISKVLLNKTILDYPLLTRIKYYHLPCQSDLSLSCFYDEERFCLCQQINQYRVANCLDFNPKSNINCSDQRVCLNGGQCFEEDAKCPRYFLCQCPECYYGTRCQVNTNIFSLSLDTILGYHIYRNGNLFKQSTAVLISSILSTILILAGLINGILLLITFQNKKTRETGCGIYLLCSSIITLMTMIIFSLKFWILIFSHMGSITNEVFLDIQCYSMDFLIRFCLAMDQWLTAFVSVERAFITIKGASLHKSRIKLIAKWIIIGLLLMTILTNIHDPIHRSLSKENEDDNDDEDDDDGDDEDERVWCIVDYPANIRTMNYVINIFHVIAPFIINFISASIIIIVKTRQRLLVEAEPSYRATFKEQIQQHKNLLIGPIVLIILVIPRLIITFATGCMKSANDSWLFLMGYFISLIPSILTFILFVLPSTVYKQEFRKSIGQFRKICQRNA